MKRKSAQLDDKTDAEAGTPLNTAAPIYKGKPPADEGQDPTFDATKV